MVKASSSKKPPIAETPEATERRRLKKLALKNNLLSDTPAAPKSYVPLSPSKQVIKHHGKDILRKSQRKNRFLFSFPGLLAPISGGKIGELKNLGSKNPILYLDFPQGQMKLFGTIVYPKNRYLSLLFSRGGKNVMCDDYFDNMIVFSDAWWIGKKDENPDEVRLDFPKELFEGQQMEYDFKGGAGVTSINKQGIPRTEMKQADTESLDTESEDALSDDESNLKVKMEATPTRHSARNAGKRFKFAEASSEEDTVRSDAEPSDGEEKKVGLKLDFSDNDIVAKPITSAPLVLGSDDSEDNQVSKQIRTNLIPVTKSKKPTQTSVTVTKSKENSNTSHGSLVQATISTLFKKAEEKVMDHAFIFATELYNYSLGSWFGLSGKKSRCKKSEKKVGQVKLSLDKNDGSSKKGKVIKGRTSGAGTKRKKEESEVEDDIEEISSTSQDTNGSDEDWTT
ncbi:DNA-binding protein RHL1 isoform X1 [Gossypium hirsutum]|uniref:DNA-binding protein RHL1 isoform X1 n=2 Tax=Gossypium hirsutum TaxID=3635 RepID=A0ABM2YNS5_GOSHI|nr:DNA-binding protein RHL1 isoform X1 [Gossypium hirsutum]